MQYMEKDTQRWGRVLWISDGKTEVAVALDFGIRVVHLSCCGCENLFYEQPVDGSDGFTTGEWKLYGGHRIWLAPESAGTYCPDNAPVRYTITNDEILFEQDLESMLKIYKRLRLRFMADGAISVEQEIQNGSDQVIDGAVWGVNTLDGGGEAEISFRCKQRGGYNPQRVISLWSDTNLADPRLQFERDRLIARHMPVPDYLKLGLYSNPGKAVLRNKGQIFELTFNTDDLELYPDNGCNFELYMCMKFMELESLGQKTRILPGQHATHTEVWRLEKCDC